MFAKRFVLCILISLAACAVAILVSLCAGTVFIPVWKGFNGSLNEIEKIILWQIRMPRMLTGLAVGGMLSLSGCVLQGIFKNPLVEPYTLGLSGGASLGVAAVILTGVPAGFLWPSAAALLGAAAVAVLLLLYYRIKPDINRLLLAGIMLGILGSACTTLLMSLSSPEDITRIVYWTMGSLDGADTQHSLILCGVAAVALILCTLLSQRVNLLSLGAEHARRVGVNTRVLIPSLVITASCATALSVAAAGIIGFIGLVVPHIARRFTGNDYRLLVPASFLCGGGFMLLCDTLARTAVQPSQLPVGAVTGIIGGSLFIYLLLESKKKSHAQD